MTDSAATKGFLTDVLDAIEQREARLLVWGLVDGRIGRDELGDLIDPLLDQAYEQGIDAFYNADDVIQALAECGLLFKSDDYPYPGYRSRMAETVRLAFRLRQLFPQHRGEDGWQQARTLVADFRFTRRRRRYPRRDLEPARVVDEVTHRLEDPTVGAGCCKRCSPGARRAIGWPSFSRVRPVVSSKASPHVAPVAPWSVPAPAVARPWPSTSLQWPASAPCA
jgi:hypothetical protein